MAMALVPQNHLGRMPEELLLEIIKQPCLSVFDLISLARTNRRHYRVAISPAYKAHVERQHGLASEWRANTCNIHSSQQVLVPAKANLERQVYWAIENERYETLDRLIETGADVNILDCDNNKKGSKCRIRSPAASALERTKANLRPSLAGFYSWCTPLAWASSLGKNSMVEYLLDHGANIEMKSDGLCYCDSEMLFFNDNSEGFRIPSLSKGLICTGDRWSPLHYAICNNYPTTAQLLLERGANPFELCGNDTVTALHFATLWGINEIIEYLMDNNLFKINAQNQCGVTSLHLAYVSERCDLVGRYLDVGADINLEYENRSGDWTIFSMACVDGLFDQALQYLQRGADPRFYLDLGLSLGDPWTVMRIIYRDIPEDLDDRAPGLLDQRISFEEAVIEAIMQRPADS